MVAQLHDRMTEQRYLEPLSTFQLPIKISNWSEVDIMSEGKSALERVNHDLGLAFDAQDLDYYYSLFRDKLARNPTTVECFDLAQSNSEHSRHWFFRVHLHLLLSHLISFLLFSSYYYSSSAFFSLSPRESLSFSFKKQGKY